MDALTLSRLQFGLTIGFHYIFPPLSIGLGLMLVIIEGLYLRTKDELFHTMARFWVRIFGLIFALGVATGIVMEFQFGTNWAAYSRFVGDVFGSALAAEGIFAFFLESGFLAILLFGWDRVSPKWHFFSALMVALGAHFSAIWIVVANSWQQTPAGFQIVTDTLTPRAVTSDFWAVVFNTSSVDRIWHVYMGAWQAGAFFVLSVGAYYLLKKRHEDFAKASVKIALIVAALASALQLVSGDVSAKGVAQNQPAKLAAFEGHYPASGPADMYLFGWVDEQAERVRCGVALPGFLSLMVHGDSREPLTGLKAFPPEDRPPVNVVFQTYHGMIAVGIALIVLAWGGLLLWWRKRLFTHRWGLWLMVFAVLGPQLANQLGWMTAEIGRQPYVVYNLLRTAEGVSHTLDASQVLTSLILFGIIYLLLFVLFIYLLNEKIQHGPEEVSAAGGHRA
jgi:cytochrome d ubiquinol oxidase subunit I